MSTRSQEAWGRAGLTPDDVTALASGASAVASLEVPLLGWRVHLGAAGDVHAHDGHDDDDA